MKIRISFSEVPGGVEEKSFAATAADDTPEAANAALVDVFDQAEAHLSAARVAAGAVKPAPKAKKAATKKAAKKGKK